MFRRWLLFGVTACVLLSAGSAAAQDPQAPPADPPPPEPVVCPPAPGPITIDGDLREWDFARALDVGRGEQVVKGKASWGGAADLSGRIFVCRSATTLYVAGEVRDDVVYWNPDVEQSWRGDGVELFFDFRADPVPRPVDQHDQDSFQLLLHPLASESRWTFAWFRGRPGRMDDPLDGVEVQGMRYQDERGATVGYRFELALPFSNFLRDGMAEGGSFGFDVALSDSDRGPEQETYATWSGRSELALYPSRFGRMVLGSDPPANPATAARTGAHLLPIIFVIVVLGLALSVWLARGLDARGSRLAGFLGRLGAVPLRPKLIVAATLTALLIGAGPALGLASRFARERDLVEKRELAALARAVAKEVLAVGLSRSPSPAEPSALLAVLRGQAVRPPAEFEYSVLPAMVVGDTGEAVREPVAQTLAGVPFLRRDVPARAAWPGWFLVHPPVAAESATAVYSWRLAPGEDTPPRAGDVVGEVRFARRDGTVETARLEWGRHVDAANEPAALTGNGHPAATDADVAFVVARGADGAARGGEAWHADALRVALGANTSPVVRVEVEQKAKPGKLTIHGVTLHPRDGSAPVPLPLGRLTRSGIPTAASAFPPPESGIVLSRATPRATIPCQALADRIWLVVSLRQGYADARYGLPVLHVLAEFDDGSVDGPFPLENGLDVDAETSLARQHGEKFRSELAFEWGGADEPRRHADVWTTALARPGRRLSELHLEFKGEGEVVCVASVVLGVPTAGPGRVDHADAPALLESTADGWRLPEAVVSRFGSVELTTYRDAVAYATTAGGTERDRALARTITPELAERIAREAEGVEESRHVDGRPVHSLATALPGPRPGAFLELTWPGEAEASLALVVRRIRTLIGILLTPLAVLLAADAILMLRTFHGRLVAVCAAVSAVPAVLGFFVIPEFVGSQIEDAEREAVTQKAALVKARLAALPVDARARAESALRDEGLRDALGRRGREDFGPAVAAALRDVERNLSAETFPGARVALDVTTRLPGGSTRAVFPPDVESTIFRDAASRLTNSLAYRWARLIARGVAPHFPPEGDAQVTLVVDLPVERAALQVARASAGGDVEVLLYTPRGFPLAETIARVASEESPEERERKVGRARDGAAAQDGILQRVLREQRPVVEARVLGGTPYTVAYDVLRGESGELSLLATALPRTGADALMDRVEQSWFLILGAGVGLQFLLLGLVAVATSRPLRRVVEQARDRTPDTEDEITSLGLSVTGLLRERDAYRAEIGNLAGAVAQLSQAKDPDSVLATALDVVASSIGPWGTIVLTLDAEGHVEVAGGRRGEERVPRMPIVVGEHSPLAPVLRGRGEARLPALGAAGDLLSRDERRLFEGATSLSAFPLVDFDRPGGALVLLERPAGVGGAAAAADRFHGDFLAALARQIGLALESARLVRLAVRDADTGAHVASYFEERLREEVDRAVAARRGIALVIASAAAPPTDAREARAAAQRLAEQMRAAAPGRAILGRLEPFTFALAVPEADRAAAEALATEVRRAAADPRLAELRVRVGYAACPEDAGSSEFLQAEARKRLGAEASDTATRPSVAPDPGDRLVAEARKFGVVFAGPEGRALLDTVRRIAASELTLLLEGETGTGKEVVADLVHRWSSRQGNALVKVNCAALPDALLESELFGYERGAFTGADRSKPGRFELADGGTLFLDEIADMPLATQAKLLRVLEDRTVEHLGGTRGVAVDVRVIAATNRDLHRMVAEGRFREDLYYRLNGVTISIPPLRARKDDIPALADAFLRAAAESQGRRAPTLQPDAMDLLYRHDWPGNVRELRNVVEQAVVLVPGETIRAADLLPSIVKSARPRGADGGSGGAFPPNGSSGPDSPAAVSDRQRRLLALLAERTWITTSEYCEIVGVSPRTALRDVRELVGRGVIVMEGRRRGARYRLP